MRFNDRTARNTSEPTHTVIMSIRMLVAVETERPMPVPIATYATMQSGHFGKIARISPGISHSVAFNRLLKIGE